MAISITRNPEPGDIRNPRVPFKEPGSAQPTIRLSALAFQGMGGDEAPAVQSPEGGVPLTPGGQGSPAVFEYTPNDIPCFGFDASLEGESPEKRPTLYRVADGRPIVRTMLAVVRLVRWPTSTASTSPENAALHLTRSSIGWSNTVCVIRPSTEGGTAKRLAMRGGAGSFLFGPEFPDDGNLHFVCAVFDGENSRLYLDGSVTSGATDAPTGQHFTTGFGLNGGYYQAVEVSHYAEVLTPLQVRAKRQHYRALYHF